jgi:hypothetical protein
MLKLKESAVYRGGKTDKELSIETRTISFNVNKKSFSFSDRTQEGMNFLFDIASKGGGVTRIRLNIKDGDLFKILKEVSEQNYWASAEIVKLVNKRHKTYLEELYHLRYYHAPNESKKEQIDSEARQINYGLWLDIKESNETVEQWSERIQKEDKKEKIEVIYEEWKICADEKQQFKLAHQARELDYDYWILLKSSDEKSHL